MLSPFLALSVLTGCGPRADHPLIDALRAGDVATVDQLLADGAEATLTLPDGSTPLTAACQSGKLPLVKTMLEAGADPNVRDTSGRSVLQYCDYHVGFESVTYLVEKGADPAELITTEKSREVFRGCMSDTFNRDEITFYMGHGMTIPATLDESGHTPLHCTATRGLSDYTTFLLENGADVNAVNSQGITPLMAFFSVDSPPRTAEHLAMLLKAGADVNATDKAGQGVLFHLRLSTEDALVRALLAAGLTVQAGDVAGGFYMHRIAPHCEGSADPAVCVAALFAEPAADPAAAEDSTGL